MTLLNASASASPLPYPWRGMRCSYCGLTLHRTVCWWANALMLPRCFRGFGEKAPDKRLHWTKIPIISRFNKTSSQVKPNVKMASLVILPTAQAEAEVDEVAPFVMWLLPSLHQSCDFCHVPPKRHHHLTAPNPLKNTYITTNN
jgi:hypothetical protein